MYKSRLKKGVTKFSNGVCVDWSKATQEEMKVVYEMNNNLVIKEEDATEVKKAEPKAKKSSKKSTNEE
jgi:CRISPR/Cas system CSM-associated protein Csm4 (group 5 of RAMP superfamily)